MTNPYIALSLVVYAIMILITSPLLLFTSIFLPRIFYNLIVELNSIIIPKE